MIWPWPDLDLRSNFQIGLSKLKSICLKPAWRGKHDGVIFIFVSPISKKVINEKKHLREKRQFFFWWPLEPKLLTLGEIWLGNVTGAWGELPNAFSEFFLAIMLLGIIAMVCEKSYFLEIRHLVTSGDLNIDLTWNDLSKSLKSRRGLSYAVYRSSLSIVVLELGGERGEKDPPPPETESFRARQE